MQNIFFSRFFPPYFFLPQQQTVKEENPDATFGEMGKLLGARWKEMDDNAKKVGYHELTLHTISI